MSAEGEQAEPEAPAEVRGYIDGIASGELIGWVADPDRPDTTLEVEAFIDGERIGAASADQVRADLTRAGYGDRHGFRIPLLVGLSPGEHFVEVRTIPRGASVGLSSDYIVYGEDDAQLVDVVLRGVEAPAPGAAAPPLAGRREVLVARDGWMFEWPGEDQFHILRGAGPMPPLSGHVDRILERDELCRAAGCVLLESVMPSKIGVYREHLPAELEVKDSGRAIELLGALIREENVGDLLDLESPLRQAKRFGPVFRRRGNTLTWLGGFAVYRAIAKQLVRTGGGLVPLLRDELALDELEPADDPLAVLPRVIWTGSGTVPAAPPAEDEDREAEPRLDWSRLSSEHVVLPQPLREIAGRQATMLRHSEPGGRRDLLMIHDGCGARVAPFLAEHFDRLLLVGADARIDRVLAEVQPAVVIEIVSEITLTG